MPLNPDPADFTPLTRVNYFTGQLLTADDLAAEQHYHREKQRRHNRWLHGAGVVAGLKVECEPAGNSGWQVTVAPGYALDCLGREIFVEAPASLDVPPAPCEFHFVTLRYAERPAENVPALGEPDSDRPMQAVRTLETYALGFVPVRELTRHLTRAGARGVCGEDHALPLARLICKEGAWRVDRRWRTPRVR